MVSVSPTQGTKPRIGSRPTRMLSSGMRMKSSRRRARRSRLSISVTSSRLAMRRDESYASIIESGLAMSSPYGAAPYWPLIEWSGGGLPDLHKDPPKRSDLRNSRWDQSHVRRADVFIAPLLLQPSLKNGLRRPRILRGGDERIAQSLRSGDAETVFCVVPPQRVEKPLIAEFLAQGDEEQPALRLHNCRVLQRITKILDGLLGLHVHAAQHPIGLISPAQLLVNDQIAQLLSVNGLVVVRGGEIGQGLIQVRGALGIAADRLAPPLFRDAVRDRKLE